MISKIQLEQPQKFILQEKKKKSMKGYFRGISFWFALQHGSALCKPAWEIDGDSN